LFDTRGYTKHSPTDGRLILSRNGAHECAPGSPGYNQQRRFALAAIEKFGKYHGRVNYKGKLITRFALEMASDRSIHGSLGGEAAKEQARQERHQAALYKWSGAAELNSGVYGGFNQF